jgi:hypothetical protein
MLIIQFIFLLVIFLGGIYFYAKYTNPAILETLVNNNTKRCPNLLIQLGSKFYLYNSNLQKVPGVNPIEFNNLEDYTDFLKWQNSVGIKCPVLYVQNTYDAQGNRVYKVRPSVLDLKGGLPPSTNTSSTNTLASTNTNLINSNVSPQKVISQTEGTIDFLKQNIPYPNSLSPIQIPEFKKLDDDPMNTNWGGEQYTEKSIAEGKYTGSEVLFY